MRHTLQDLTELTTLLAVLEKGFPQHRLIEAYESSKSVAIISADTSLQQVVGENPLRQPTEGDAEGEIEPEGDVGIQKK